MRINVIGMNFLHTTWNKQNQGSNMHRINKYPCDTVSFTSKTDSRKEENNLVDALATIGFVGIPLVSSIIIGTELMKHSPKGNEIFLSDGSYLCNVNDLKLESDKVIADADDGVLKVKDSPIDIDASKVDYADPMRGVYKNFDGSVDIDLLNQKYIDTKNGIYVDVPHGISKFVENGEIKELPLINFEGSSMSGANPPHTPYKLPSDTINDGIIPATIDRIKETVNMIFGVNLPTGYMVDENGHKIPMREWLKEHDTLNRDFRNGEDNSSFENYVQEHNIPISINDNGTVSSIDTSEDNDNNDGDQNYIEDNSDCDNSYFEDEDYDFN